MRDAPTWASSCWTAWLAADWETKLCCAPREKLRWRTTSQYRRSVSTCMRRSYTISSPDTYHTTFEGRLIIRTRSIVWQLFVQLFTKGTTAMMQQQPSLFAGQVQPQGLYDPRHEHDACGVGFVVNIKGKKSHTIVRQALQVLINLLHRGACGCEPNTGDGAGILLQTPDKFLRRECDRLSIPLPGPKEYGCGLVFLPRDPEQRDRVRALLHSIVEEEGSRLLGWRDVPTDDHLLGATALSVEPNIQQVFIGRGPGVHDHARFERKLYVIRKLFEKAVAALDIPENKFAYIPSLSSNTLIYKGMLSANQIETMYPDLTDPDVESALALVHQRFSTNTF